MAWSIFTFQWMSRLISRCFVKITSAFPCCSVRLMRSDDCIRYKSLGNSKLLSRSIMCFLLCIPTNRFSSTTKETRSVCASSLMVLTNIHSKIAVNISRSCWNVKFYLTRTSSLHLDHVKIAKLWPEAEATKRSLRWPGSRRRMLRSSFATL